MSSLSNLVAGGIVGAGNGGLEGAMLGMFSASAFGAIGQEFKGVTGLSPAAVAGHAVVGCIMGTMSGGSCGPSAVAAAAGKISSSTLDGLSDLEGLLASTIAGGTVSVIGGGKFANGAVSAAAGYIFNQLATERVLTGSGHHILPDEVVRKLGITSADALKVFDSNDARIPVENHNGARPSPSTVSHAQYNKLSLDEGKKWLETNKVDPSKMTGDQARDMVRHFKSAAPYAIRQFNQVQYSRALDQAMRRAWYRNPGARATE